MHRRGQERQLTQSPSRASAPRPGSLPAPSFLLAVVALLSTGVVGGVGCGDKDTTDVTPTGGSGGAAGSAGIAGTGGTAGTAGTAGTGGAGDDLDAGTDGGTDADSGDGGDSGPPAPDPGRLARAQTLCQHEEDLADCASPPDTCVQGFLDAQNSDAFFPPECSDEIIAFYQCLADAGADAFICRDDVPDYRLEAIGDTTPCSAEEAAWLAAQGDPTTCVD